ncbi:hypothetical protein [Oryza sativa Japonica Group]|uniref:Uncharacterized protein n=1 Tax=Oryza sativa subsp. japonica TaxID=39947 RepID=Q5NAE2_ORYSJ|nr:hypothetical protein [Oryza sativa Japonica Group]
MAASMASDSRGLPSTEHCAREEGGGAPGRPDKEVLLLVIPFPILALCSGDTDGGVDGVGFWGGSLAASTAPEKKAAARRPPPPPRRWHPGRTRQGSPPPCHSLPPLGSSRWRHGWQRRWRWILGGLPSSEHCAREEGGGATAAASVVAAAPRADPTRKSSSLSFPSPSRLSAAATRMAALMASDSGGLPSSEHCTREEGGGAPGGPDKEVLLLVIPFPLSALPLLAFTRTGGTPDRVANFDHGFLVAGGTHIRAP